MHACTYVTYVCDVDVYKDKFSGYVSTYVMHACSSKGPPHAPQLWPPLCAAHSTYTRRPDPPSAPQNWKMLIFDVFWPKTSKMWDCVKFSCDIGGFGGYMRLMHIPSGCGTQGESLTPYYIFFRDTLRKKELGIPLKVRITCEFCRGKSSFDIAHAKLCVMTHIFYGEFGCRTSRSSFWVVKY